MLLHLVRHGPPVIEPGQPASSWLLDDAATSKVQQLRIFLAANVGSASWYSSDEPKAIATAHRLTDVVVEVEPELKEAVRSDWFTHPGELRAAVFDAFNEPSRPGRPGWEPLDLARARVGAAVGGILGRSGADVVLVGHGTAWTLLVSEITGETPDLDAWLTLRMPDHCTLDPAARSVVQSWGDWQRA